MRRAVVATITVGVVLAGASAASAYQFTFATPIPHQQQVQRALSLQLNRQVAKHWKIDPVSFAPGGIPITVLPDLTGLCAGAASGCHILKSQIYVQGGNFDNLTQEISHEMIETETDPGFGRINGLAPEAADPVAWQGYWLLGVALSDYVYPRFYYNLPVGPWDQRGVEQGPMATDPRCPTDC